VGETALAAATYILQGSASAMTVSSEDEDLDTVTVKVARSALQIPLALRERAGVMETVMAAATYIVRGGADAMAVSVLKRSDVSGYEPMVARNPDGTQHCTA